MQDLKNQDVERKKMMKLNRFYKDNSGHYYKRLGDGALHINEGECINTIPEHMIPILETTSSTRNPVEEITEEEFDSSMRITIFELGLYIYIKEK